MKKREKKWTSNGKSTAPLPLGKKKRNRWVKVETLRMDVK